MKLLVCRPCREGIADSQKVLGSQRTTWHFTTKIMQHSEATSCLAINTEKGMFAERLTLRVPPAILSLLKGFTSPSLPLPNLKRYLLLTLEMSSKAESECKSHYSKPTDIAPSSYRIREHNLEAVDLSQMKKLYYYCYHFCGWCYCSCITCRYRMQVHGCILRKNLGTLDKAVPRRSNFLNKISAF